MGTGESAAKYSQQEREMNEGEMEFFSCLGSYFHRQTQDDPIQEYISLHSNILPLRNRHGQTVLMFAAQHNRPQLCKYLIEYGCEVNAQDLSGATAMHYGISTDLGVLNALIEHGEADVNLADKDGDTPLQAATFRIFDAAEFLIMNEADVNAENKKKLTPLHYAILSHADYEKIEDSLKLIKLFLNGANGRNRALALKYAQENWLAEDCERLLSETDLGGVTLGDVQLTQVTSLLPDQRTNNSK